MDFCGIATKERPSSDVIDNILTDCGYNWSHCGTAYMRAAAMQYDRDVAMMRIYERIGEQEQKSPGSVERSMRHATMRMFQYGDKEAQREWFGGLAGQHLNLHTVVATIHHMAGGDAD